MTEHRFVNVEVTVDESGAFFTCPDCGARIRITNKFPVGFDWKVCRRCRRMWVRSVDMPIGPHRSDLEPGTVLEMTVMAGHQV
jgi:hypothetical protein